jgi:DNA-directed RNA polymerase omega subunit
MSLIASRGTAIDTEKCVAQINGNKYDLVLAAAARSREIKRRNQSSMRQEHVGAPVSALLEIQEGKVTNEYLLHVE